MNDHEKNGPPPGRYGDIARNVMANWLWFVLVLASGLIVPRVIAGRQGKEMLGAWDLGWSLGFYVSLFSLGLTSAITRYVARYRALGDWRGLNAVVSTGLLMMVVGAAAGALCSIGFAALTPWLVEGAGPETARAAHRMILLLSIAAACQFPGAVFSGIITGYERYDLHNLIRILFDGLLLVAMIGLLLAGCGLVTLAWVILLMEVPGFAARLWTARRLCPDLRISLSHVRMFTARDMVGFSGKSLLQWAASSALYQLNGILVSAFMGPAALAVYSRQRVLVLQCVRFVKQYATVFTPSSSALHATGDLRSLQGLILASSRYGMYLTLPLFLLLIVMGGPIVDLWMKPGYAAPLVLGIMALGHLAAVPQQGVYMILMGMGRHGVPALFDAAGAVLSILLAVVLMGLLEGSRRMVGGALAMAVPVALMGGVALPVYACRLLGLSWSRYLRHVTGGPMLANLPFLGCLVVARWMYPHRPVEGLLIGLTAGGLVNILIYWQWVLPPEVRRKILARWRPRVTHSETRRAAGEIHAPGVEVAKT